MYLGEMRDSQELGRLFHGNPFRSIEKGVRRLAKHDPVFRAVKKLDMQVKKEVARSKIAQGIIYGAGAVAAPFTGGLSMAAAAAAVQASKAAKAGRSFGAQILQGAGAGSIGWMAGVGLVYGAGAAGIGPGTLTGPGGLFAPAVDTAAASDAGMLYAPAAASSTPIVTPAGAALSPAASAASAAASDAGTLYAPTEAVTSGTVASSTSSSIGAGLKAAGGVLKDTFGIMTLIRSMGSKVPGAAPDAGVPANAYGLSTPGAYGATSGGDTGGGSGGGGGMMLAPGDAGAPAPAGIMQGRMPYYLAGGAVVLALALSSKRIRRGSARK